ncbi:hypothetical protein ACHAXR_005312, partial [Thalassiosira sp. AJA248-18]
VESKTFGSCGPDGPTTDPTSQPTDSPTTAPTKVPTKEPTSEPTYSPTTNPTHRPTNAPIKPTPERTDGPTTNPTHQPNNGPTTNPTSKPTESPTIAPSKSPTKEPTLKPTDTPTTHPTSQPTDAPSTSPTQLPTKEPTSSPTSLPPTPCPHPEYCLPPGMYTFIIKDAWGDGICCGYQAGYYKVMYGETVEKEGGEFGLVESKTFGSCGPDGPTTDPTSQPTDSPTTAPTKVPTKEPTAEPTAKPSPEVFATYNSNIGAPSCLDFRQSCKSETFDSVALIDGVSTSELHYPNTLDACTDGAEGVYHIDESVDMITVSSATGDLLEAGRMAEIEAKVWAYSQYTSDRVDFYYATDAYNPVWTLIASEIPEAAGVQTLKVQYQLQNGDLQAVRVIMRYGIAQPSSNGCSGGVYDDADDLVFAVDAADPGNLVLSSIPDSVPTYIPPPIKPLEFHCESLSEKRCMASSPFCTWHYGHNECHQPTESI